VGSGLPGDGLGDVQNLDAIALGFGPDDEANLIASFREIATMDLGDGIVFDANLVKADAIREDNTYGGTRITLVARIGSARCTLQIDVGFGDVVTPGPQTVAYPTLLGDFPAPTLRVYPVYTVIAEKYQAMVMLGQANSRMKDFFDLAVIARRTALDGATLAAAIAATFAWRQTHLPTERPLALTKQFSEDAAKLRQWQAFLNKNHIEAGSLCGTVSLLDDESMRTCGVSPHGRPKTKDAKRVSQGPNSLGGSYPTTSHALVVQQSSKYRVGVHRRKPTS
jgi:hypothetical protein